MTHLHVIPVPDGMTAEESWAEIVTLGRLVEPPREGEWATICCDGEMCADVEQEPIHAPGKPVDLSGACDDCRAGFHGDCRGREQVVRGEAACACDCPDAVSARRPISGVQSRG